jgi:hypothetical protein
LRAHLVKLSRCTRRRARHRVRREATAGRGQCRATRRALRVAALRTAPCPPRGSARRRGSMRR